jgi:hypothetical protein
MEQDLKNLPLNIFNIKNDVIKKEYKKYILLEYAIINELKKGYHPNRIFEILLDNSSHIDLSDISDSIKFISFLSSEFYSNRNREWLSINEFNNFDDETKEKLVVFIKKRLEEKYQNLGIKNIFLKSIYNSIKEGNASFNNEFKLFLKYMDRIERLRNIFYNESKERIKAFFNLVDELSNFIIDFTYFVNESDNVTTDYKKMEIKDILNNFTSIIETTYNKEYGLMLVKLENLLEQFIKNNKDISENTKEEYLEYVILISQYGSVFVDLIKSETEEDVDAVISRIVLPQNSYRIKQIERTNLYLSFNGYVGFLGGYNFNDKTMAFSIFMPIGFELGLNYGFSVFFTFADLGSYIAKKDTEHDTIDDFKFEQILAPGAFLNYEIPKTPITLGLGGQYFNTLNGQNNVFRLGATISIDIPFFIWDI